MIVAATEDPRLQAIATVSGNYLYPENIEFFYNGKPPPVEKRIELGKKAKEKFLKTGQVEYRKLIDPNSDDVALPHKPPLDFYTKWMQNSRWQNR